MNAINPVGLPVAGRRMAVLVAAAILFMTPAFAQKRQAAPAGAAQPATITGELAERMPAGTTFYVELAGARSAAERTTVDETYTKLVTALGGFGGGEPPLTLEEFQMLAASNIAFGMQLDTGSVSKGPTGWLVIIRTESASNAAALTSKVTSLLGKSGPTGKAPGGSLVRGRRVVPLSATTSVDSPHYSVAGESILIGDRQSVTRTLRESAVTGAPSLATTELYRDGLARVGSDTGLLTLFKPPVNLFGKPDAEGAEPSIATLTGLRSLRGVVSGSEPWSPGSAGTTVVALESGARNLLTIFAGGPPVTLRNAGILPSDTAIVTSFSLDLPAIEALFRSSKAAKDAGVDVADLEQRLGVDARDQLLQSLGSEVTVGLRFETPPASMTMGEGGVSQSSSPSPQLKVIALVEVKQPDVVRPVLERALAGPVQGETAVRDVDGVRIAGIGNNAVAVVDGVAVVGEPGEIERLLRMRTAGQTLDAAHELDTARSRLDGDSLAIVHPTPALKETLGSSAATLGLLVNASAMGLSELDDTVVRREPLGIVVTARGGSAFSVAAIGIIAAVAIPGLLQARGAANESAAIGTLRSLASAQATYHAKNGRFGTMAELVAEENIDSSLHNGVERNGYVFREIRPTAKTFEFTATPVGGVAGEYSYNIVEDYVIRSGGPKAAPRRKAGKPLGAP